MAAEKEERGKILVESNFTGSQAEKERLVAVLKRLIERRESEQNQGSTHPI